MAVLTFAVAVQAMAAPSDAVFFVDRFEERRVGDAWVVASGGWKHEDGCLVSSRPGGAVSTGDTNWRNYTVEAKLKTVRPGPKPWSVARVLLRHTDAKNCYYVLLHQNGLLELGKEQGGKHRPGLATAKNRASPLAWHTLRIQARDERIRVWLDGEPKLDCTDPDPLWRGKVGLDAFQGALVSFDDVRLSSREIAEQIKRRRERTAQVLRTVGYRRSAKGNIAIFRDAGVPVHESAPSDPERLGRILTVAGYGVTFVDARALSDRGLMARLNFDIVILPYGSAFPRGAMPAFRRFLRQGGSFVSMGGYFGDNLYDAEDRADANLLRNGGFEDGLKGWTKGDARVEGLSIDVSTGRAVVHIRVTDEAPSSFYDVSQRIAGLQPGTVVQAKVRVRTEGVQQGHGAYIALNYFDADGKRIRWDQSKGVRGTHDWMPVAVLGEIPARTAWVTVNLLLHGRGQAWFDDGELTPGMPGARCLNTREGDIHGPGNSLRVSPAQIGVFDPGYRLENVTHLRAGLSFELSAEAAGYSASGLFIGNGNPVRAVTHARPIHLIEALDKYGRRCGSAGALIRNYRGHYAGSDWAVFGVNNIDLFAPQVQGSAQLLTDTVAAMQARVFIAEVGTELACYRRGEPVKLRARLANYGRSDRTAELRFTVADRTRTRRVHEQALSVALPPGGTVEASVNWQPAELDNDFYEIEIQLVLDGRVVDTMRSAFVLWQEGQLKSGPRFEVRDAYLSRNGRTAFLCGTDESGYCFFAQSEDPLVWDEEFRLMRDLGLRIYRGMHFFTVFDPKKPFHTLDDLPRARLRRLDAMVSLSQHYDLMFLFVSNVGLQLARGDPAQLRARKNALRLLAARYADVPGFVFNMDHQEFIRKPQAGADRALRGFLSERYGGTEKWAAAWGRQEVTSLDQVHFDERPATRAAWNSAQSLDVGEFLYSYREAWRSNGADAVHSGNRAALYCQDFSLYWWPDFPWPAPETLERLDVTGTHFYGDAAQFPVRIKRADMQIMGKPIAQTEFGLLTHPAWQGHRDARLTHDAADAFLMMAGHYCLGLGATMMSNWNWKEMKECIFPWAIAHHDLVPKAHALAYRNMALLFSTFSPCYTPPQVFIVVPSAHLKTGKVRQVDAGVLACIRRLLSCHVHFGLIGEGYLKHVPESAKALFYPIPFCPPDEAIARLTAFVRSGGCLYFSGDISFDSRGERTKGDRLRMLAGVHYVSENYPHLRVPGAAPNTPAIKVRAGSAQVLVDSEAGPRAVHHVLGRGHVIFCPDPVEVSGGDVVLPAEAVAQLMARRDRPMQASDVYNVLLDLAGVDRIDVLPRDPDLHAFEIPTQAGGRVFVFYNTGERSREIAVRYQGRALRLNLAGQRPGLAHFSSQGTLLAVECQDRATVDGEPIISGQGHFMATCWRGNSETRAGGHSLVMVVGEGSALLNPTPELHNPVVQYGEFRNGKWHALLTEVPPPGQIRVQAYGSLRSVLTLVTNRESLDQARASVEALLAR